MVDRQELFSALSAAVAGVDDGVVGGCAIEAGHVHTQILEAHPDEASPDGARALLQQAGESHGLTVRQLADELWQLNGPRLSGFVDTLNPRFWQVHATGSVDELGKSIRRMVFDDARLDVAWFPRRLLRELDGKHMWLRSAFNGDELVGPEARARRWRARFEGDAPEDLLDLLERDPRYAAATSVTAIGSVVAEPNVGHASVVADYRGHFITGEGDFSVALSAVWNAVRRYEDWVRELEARHHLTAAPIDANGLMLSGDVAVIELEQPALDLERLVEGLFRAKAPFRLWAVPRQLNRFEWAADAVDLHVGQPLRIEISPDRIRVLLEPDTCGNTLARLITNLQQRLDARTQLLAGAA